MPPLPLVPTTATTPKKKRDGLKSPKLSAKAAADVMPSPTAPTKSLGSKSVGLVVGPARPAAADKAGPDSELQNILQRRRQASRHTPTKKLDSVG